MADQARLVDRIAEVLAQHRTWGTGPEVYGGDRYGLWRWECGCGTWRTEPFDLRDDQAGHAAAAAAMRHQAEQVARVVEEEVRDAV